QDNDAPQGAPPAGPNFLPLLGAGLIFLVCIAFYQATQTENLLRKIAESQRESAVLRKNLTHSGDELGKALTRFHGELTGLRDDATQNSAELRAVRGNTGSINNRVATNLKEVERLRELGDRNIYQFTLMKAGDPQQVGGIELKLNKIDEKRNTFNVEIIADDK